MKIIAIDWETLGLTPSAPLIVLGWVTGDTDSGEVYGEGEIVIPVDFNTKFNRPIEHDTVLWWMERAQESFDLQNYIINRLRLMEIQTLPSLRAELQDLLRHIDIHHLEGLFCTDKNFDLAHFLFTLDSLSLTHPLSYRQYYETRYMQQQQYPEVFERAKKNLTSHTAKDDAMWLFEALHMILH